MAEIAGSESDVDSREFYCLDIERWNVSTTDERQSMLKSLNWACRRDGAFYLTAPLLTPQFMDRIHALMKEYFSFSLEEKMKLYIANSVHHRGYFPFFDENAKGSVVKDAKEGFDLALHLPINDGGCTLRGPNVYPESPIGFQKLVDEYFVRLTRTAEVICILIARSLGLCEDYFIPMTTKPLSQLRLLHYPGSRSKPTTGAGEHTDYGLVTIIWQDQRGGLEVRNRVGELRRVDPISGRCFCNLGDAMSILTEGHYFSAPHQVINRSPDSRYSTAFFFDPDHDAVLQPMPQFIDRFGSKKFQPITMGDYVTSSFDHTFVYRGKRD